MKQNEPTKLNKQARHPYDIATLSKEQGRTERVPIKPRRKKTTFKAAAAVCGAGSLGRCPLVGLVSCYPVCLVLPAFANRGFSATFMPLRPTPLGTTRIGCVAIPAQCRLMLMPPCHDVFCCFEDSAIPLARLLSCNGPHLGLHPKHQLGVFRGPLGGIKRLEVVK